VGDEASRRPPQSSGSSGCLGAWSHATTQSLLLVHTFLFGTAVVQPRLCPNLPGGCIVACRLLMPPIRADDWSKADSNTIGSVARCASRRHSRRPPAATGHTRLSHARTCVPQLRTLSQLWNFRPNSSGELSTVSVNQTYQICLLFSSQTSRFRL